MVTFCKTIVQYHIQLIDIDIVTYRTVSSPQGSCVLPFYSHIHLAPHCFLLLIFPYPWQPLLCSVLLKFYTNGMIQYVPYWDWLFNSAKFPGDSPRLLHMSTVRSFLLLTSMLWYGYTTACLTIHIIWLTRTYFSPGDGWITKKHAQLHKHTSSWLAEASLMVKPKSKGKEVYSILTSGRERRRYSFIYHLSSIVPLLSIFYFKTSLFSKSPPRLPFNPKVSKYN